MIEKSYKETIVKIIDDIKSTQKAIFAGANKDLFGLYYRIGEHIDKNAVYGNKIIDNLSMDLRVNFPKAKGFSARNLHNMHKYYKVCINSPILQTASAKLPWSHYANLTQFGRWRLPNCPGAIIGLFLTKLRITM